MTMTLLPLLDAPAAIQAHVTCATLALLTGPLALFRRRRDRWHRLAGRVWILAMIGAAGSSFLIAEARTLGPFSPIHILSVMTFIGVAQGLIAIRRGQIATHARAMRALYAQAMILPAVFAFLPGRRMSLALFPDAQTAGFVTVALLGALVILAVWRLRPALPAAAPS
jgi:uncharacterized membrane protein